MRLQTRKQGPDTFRCLSFSLPSPLINNPSSLFISASVAPAFYRHVNYCPSGFPLQSDTSTECVSIHLSCLTLATPRTGRQPENITEAASCRPTPPADAPPPPPLVTDEHIRQGAGLVDEKKFTNCLIIQIFMIMNRYSTVREHGVQPELPPQHSSCESWLLISGWLSGTNNPGTSLKIPSCVFFFTVCTCNCCTVTVLHTGLFCTNMDKLKTDLY